MATSVFSKTGKPILDQRKGKLQPYRQDQIRQQIQVRSILNIIQDHILTGTDIAASRIHAGLKLIDKVLPNAIPDAIAANNQAQAIESIQRAQLVAMAQEMLRQGQLDASTIDEQSMQIAENNCSDAHVIATIPATVETSTDESE